MLCIIVVESYDWTGKHTYFPMAITIGSVLLMCVALIGLYNKLAPRPIGGEMKAANSVAGNIDIEQEESVGMDISPTLYVLI